MPKTTHNYEQAIDYIETIAALGEPFNSSLLDSYAEYLSTTENLKTTTFLGALNLIGQTGCKFLYDKVINYIDDVSNVDTCNLDALSSMANSLQVPYKDKHALEQLSTLVKLCSNSSSVVKLLMWILSLNVRNSKHIINRLAIVDNDFDLSTINTRSELFANENDIAINLKKLLSQIIEKQHIAPPNASQIGFTPNKIIQYSWNFLPLVKDLINTNQSLYTLFAPTQFNSKLDFGKYQTSIHENTCVKLLRLKNSEKSITLTNEIIKKELPFLFDLTLFDPIAIAESVIIENLRLDKYTETQRNDVNLAISAINSTSQFILNSYADVTLTTIKWINKLNTRLFNDEYLLYTTVNAIKEIFNIDIVTYMSIAGRPINDVDEENANSPVAAWWTANFSNNQFAFIDKITTDIDELDNNYLIFDVNQYVADVYNAMLQFADKLTIIREDLKLLTLRNSLKGTSAIIQLAIAEYLNDHFPEIVDATIAEIIPEKYKLNIKSDESLIARLNEIYQQAILNPCDVNVIEYWDLTEYFGRTTDKNDMYPADWNLNPRVTHGDVSTSNIVRFYANTLGLSKNTFKENIDFDYDIDLSTAQGMNAASAELITFLTHVYNAGIFDKTLPNNIEKLFSGNPATAALKQFYTNFKTFDIDEAKDRISKQTHPYIWNFTTHSNKIKSNVTAGTVGNSATVDNSGSVTAIQQDTSLLLLNELIAAAGNILNQWKLSLSKFIDDSNYWTRYEAYDHDSDEYLIGYDGFVYPKFANDLQTHVVSDNTDAILDTIIPNENISIYDKWYKIAGKQSFIKSQYKKENKILKSQLQTIKDIVDPSKYQSVAINDRSTLQNYSVDSFGTAYAVDKNPDDQTKSILYYKEAAYPVMRPLRQIVDNEQLGITFIDANKNKVIDDYAEIDINYVDTDKHFPNIVISESGKYILLRLNATQVGYFYITMWTTPAGYAEKALQLLYIVDFSNLIAADVDSLCQHITEGGVKTIDNDIAILLTDIDNNNFNEYLLIVTPTMCKLSKQIINCANSDENAASKLTAGLTLVNDALQREMKVIVSTFGITNDVLNYSDIDGFKTTNLDERSYLTTSIKNTSDALTTSFDIFKQFIHILVNSNAGNHVETLKTISAPYMSINDIKTFTLSKTPENTQTFAFTKSGFASQYYFSDKILFCRKFNLNSDAGFNPCYLGDNGKLVLSDRINQAQLAKTIGVGVELLGPETIFTDVNNDAAVSTSDNNDNAFSIRIHECTYADVTETKAAGYTEYEKAKSLAEYSVYNEQSIPRLFTCTLDKFCLNINDTTADDSLDIVNILDYPNAYVMHSSQFAATDVDLASNKVGVAFLLFKTGENQIWIPTAFSSSAKFNENEFGKNLFNIIFKGAYGRVDRTYQIKQTDDSLTDPYIFNSVHISRSEQTNDVVVKLSGSLLELKNIEVVVVGVVANNNDTTLNPTFMLTGSEYSTSIGVNDRTNFISYHSRANHGHGDHHGNKYHRYANDKQPAEYYIDKSYTIDTPAFMNGSLSLSLLEQDSVELGTIMPNQEYDFTAYGKTVLAELLNELFRKHRMLYGTSTEIDYIYKFIYFQFEYLNLVDVDYQQTAQNSNSLMYYVQLANTVADVSNLDYLKQLTYSAWRVSETLPTGPQQAMQVDTVLPAKIKITEQPDAVNIAKPVYINSVIDADIQKLNIIPKLGIRWKYKNTGIDLRFDNATLADSIFTNENSGLTYKQLSNTPTSLQLTPTDEPTYLNVVSPIHIIAGNTVFVDIPLSTVLLTNVSDDKPKFLLSIKSTITEDNTNGDAYALVFDTATTPEIEKLNVFTAHCYVAKLDSLRQTTIPQIDTAVQLKQLLFNMNISNVLNTTLNDTVDARDNTATVQIASIYGKTPTQVIDRLKQATAIRNNNNESIKITIKAKLSKNPTESEKIKNCFSVVDFAVNLHDVTKYTLKNALISAKPVDCVALDKNGNKLYIAKVFGCDFNKIGNKQVLGTSYYNEKFNNSVDSTVVATQATTGRKTAIIVNPIEK